ncbi:MAG: ABC transporter permease [Anaerolineaceae bacterium]|nr:ABC transporter permease [Anaerolineaceae bacterium]MCY3935219.1 ABC transporter permease [Chloroflexota bacterium]MCY4008564.1 ABC transporter permease [Anaerolineaceae bacterium]MCY4106514.1 ABC transporter permease [Chloroflexota bacterium]
MDQTDQIKGLEVHQERSLWWDALVRLSRNRAAVTGAIIILVILIAAVFAPMIAPKGFDEANLRAPFAIPLWISRVFPNLKPMEEGGYTLINNEYPLGADKLGRDVFSRILYGARVSLLVAFIGPTVALILGTIIGVTSGFLGGGVDNAIMRIADVMYAFPTLLFIILMLVYFRNSFRESSPGTFIFALGRLDASIGGLLFVFIGIGITSWMGNGRLARGQVLSIRQTEYIAAARALGASTPRILFRHVMPNILGPMIIAETLAIPAYISYEAFLSFIGLGVLPPTPSWGGMIAEGAQYIQNYPYLTVFPALALFIVMFAFNFLGDGLRDALDPRMRGVD